MIISKKSLFALFSVILSFEIQAKNAVIIVSKNQIKAINIANCDISNFCWENEVFMQKLLTMFFPDQNSITPPSTPTAPLSEPTSFKNSFDLKNFLNSKDPAITLVKHGLILAMWINELKNHDPSTDVSVIGVGIESSKICCYATRFLSNETSKTAASVDLIWKMMIPLIPMAGAISPVAIPALAAVYGVGELALKAYAELKKYQKTVVNYCYKNYHIPIEEFSSASKYFTQYCGNKSVQIKNLVLVGSTFLNGSAFPEILSISNKCFNLYSQEDEMVYEHSKLTWETIHKNLSLILQTEASQDHLELFKEQEKIFEGKVLNLNIKIPESASCCGCITAPDHKTLTTSNKVLGLALSLASDNLNTSALLEDTEITLDSSGMFSTKMPRCFDIVKQWIRKVCRFGCLYDVDINDPQFRE